MPQQPLAQVPKDAQWYWQELGSCRTADPLLFFHPQNERGTSRMRRDRDSRLSSTAESAAICRRSTWSSEVCSLTTTLSTPWTLANWLGCGATTSGARASPQSLRGHLPRHRLDVALGALWHPAAP